MWAGQAKAPPLNQENTLNVQRALGGGGTDACALKVMKDSCVNSDFKIIMALEARENGTIS